MKCQSGSDRLAADATILSAFMLHLAVSAVIDRRYSNNPAKPMSTYFRTTILSLTICISLASPLFSQEEEVRRTEPSTAPASPAASAAATTPPLSSSVTPAPTAGATPQLTDVLFKNVKARAIGPAVMGGRISD